jgi:hypothetical protein
MENLSGLRAKKTRNYGWNGYDFMAKYIDRIDKIISRLSG